MVSLSNPERVPPFPQRAEDVIRAAAAMWPALRQRQAECEALGRLPEQTNRELVDAGFYRILQPRRFGGLELDLATFFQVMANIARGCPSTGWVLALTAGHAHMLSVLYSEQAQIDIFGPDGEYRAPASLRGSAKAVLVPGGYRVSGSWSYCSGIDSATHFIGGGIRVPDSEQRLLAIVPCGVYRIEEDWDVLGMRGTGSHRVVLEDVFVPEHHTAPALFDYATAHAGAGRNVHPNPFYTAGRIASVLWGEMAAVAVGIAQGALDVFEDELRIKKLGFPPFTQRSQVPEYQRQFGEAWALIAMAESTLLRVGHDYMRFCEEEAAGGEPFGDQRDRQLQLLEQYITKLAADAVDIMFRTAGTSATRSESPLQRSFRDMAMIRTHFAAQYERGAEEFGRGYFEAAEG
jgi:3-hydroxy-9,10-secoandrosta-1,3,5(10)-triene-9,17-dione monooxygenase